jgi:RNA polymerase sigma-70 factor (ECF subfamily)
VASRQAEFERVAMPHSRSLLRVARRLSLDSAAAEDLVQQTYLLAWKNFHQFRAGTNVRAWLFRILFNEFYALGRKTQSTPVMIPLGARAELRTAPSAVEAAEISEALGELAVEHRTVLLLGVVEGFTCQEMSEILSVPIGTVMSRLSRAREAMRVRLSVGAAKLSEKGAS